MADIYDQHEAAFPNVAAFVILGKDSDNKGNPVRVATIAFKFPKDGAGRLYAYVHYFGVEMVRGFAAGGGYDKKSAAVAAAVSKLSAHPDVQGWAGQLIVEYDDFRAVLANDDGAYWDSRLRAAGFTVLQAV